MLKYRLHSYQVKGKIIVICLLLICNSCCREEDAESITIIERVTNYGESQTRTLAIELQGVELRADRRGIVGVDIDESSFIHFMHTAKYLRFSPKTDTINSIDILGEERLEIFCYDDNLDFLSVSSNFQDIQEGTRFIKIQVGSPNRYESSRVLNFNVTMTGHDITYVKNKMDSLCLNFSFEAYLPYYDNSSIINYSGSQERVYDNGYLMLPPNYSIYGNPVPLVIFSHGTGGYSWSQSGCGNYETYKEFIVKNGYALCDCSGLTNKYKDHADAFAAPSHMSCYEELVKYITTNYNVRTDGVYVCGKSAGGYMTALLVYKQPFKVKAAGALAPALGWTFSSLPVEKKDAIQMQMEQLGFGDREWSDMLRNDEDRLFIIKNIDELKSNDPFFINSDINASLFLQQIYDKNLWSKEGRFNLGSDEILDSLVINSHKYIPVPYKIWIAEDDDQTPYCIAKMFKTMIDNTGGPCYLRTLPSGTGKHHAVDTSDLAVKTVYLTKYGGVAYVPVAYAELVDWFNRW